MRRERSAAAGAVPVTLLTGFLGAGKTTLLNAVLADPASRGTAVIVNEFGSVAVDHDLVRRGSEQYMVTTSGCLCCTAGSDVRATLFDLHEAARFGFAPMFSRVVVETTGLADPAPIVNSLIPGGAPAIGLRDHTVARRYRLASVVAAFDAVSGEAALDRHLECWKQLAFADRVVLTKTDLADGDGRLGELRARLGRLNPSAPVLDRHAPRFDAAGLLGDGSYTPSGKPDDVLGWLALERAATGHAHDHDVNRHGDRVSAVPLVADAAVELGTLRAFLTLLTGATGMLRVKGLVRAADDPERPVVVHAVQHVLYPFVRLDRWPSDDRRSRLVVIATDVSPAALTRLFSAVIAVDAPAQEKQH